MNGRETVTYVVGEERRLTDLLRESEVMPLLRAALDGDNGEAAVVDDAGEPLWRQGSEESGAWTTRAIFLEGEPAGAIRIRGAGVTDGQAGLLATALQTLATANLKRMLTSEIHTVVVNQSYEELVEANERLAASEARYRELAESLDLRVRERTTELERAHARLLQQEKMASVGQLAAGVAHEINNPLGFITSNLSTLSRYVERFRGMLDFCREGIESGRGFSVGDFHDRWRELRLDHVTRDVDELLAQSREGAERVKRIVADLKGFSHVDEAEEAEVDVNRELARTLNVLVHAIPAGTELATDYGTVPPLTCRPALLGQVFLSIILNACEARGEGLRLAISTGSEGGAIRIAIADNGPGIPEAIRQRIFEPFFTTKEVGKGTGMGLAVVYDVVGGLGGTVEAECPAGGGTCFTIILPVQRST